ncbi:hypothetical protein GFB49_18645 [Epibacterium sp. SM1979]|uniref:Uncharacterized protein n=1 Tax=Tritonibacter litoralis TaxID=2662264 RepID=A0A843YPF7_9RHOB|nr:hypothetical protein [Tritonibacter litoralis]MQQ10487.1 hypothetical protein [Tritonibacter litoralis]
MTDRENSPRYSIFVAATAHVRFDILHLHPHPLRWHKSGLSDLTTAKVRFRIPLRLFNVRSGDMCCVAELSPLQVQIHAASAKVRNSMTAKSALRTNAPKAAKGRYLNNSAR